MKRQRSESESKERSPKKIRRSQERIESTKTLVSKFPPKDIILVSLSSRIATIAIKGTNYGTGFLFENDRLVTPRRTFPADANAADLTFLSNPSTTVHATVLCSANHCTTLQLKADPTCDQAMEDLNLQTLPHHPLHINYDANLSQDDEVKLLALDEKEGLKWIEAKIDLSCSTFFDLECASLTTILMGSPVFNKDNQVIGIIIESSPDDGIAASYLNEIALNVKQDIKPTVRSMWMVPKSAREAVVQELAKKQDSWRQIAAKLFVNQKSIIDQAGDDELARCHKLLEKLNSQAVLKVKTALIDIGLHETAERLGRTEFVHDPWKSHIKFNP